MLCFITHALKDPHFPMKLIIFFMWRSRLIWHGWKAVKMIRFLPWCPNQLRTTTLQSKCYSAMMYLKVLEWVYLYKTSFHFSYQRIRNNQTGPVPSTYRCFKCQAPGVHWFKDCPLKDIQVGPFNNRIYFRVDLSLPSFLIHCIFVLAGSCGHQEEYWDPSKFYGSCWGTISTGSHDDSYWPFCCSCYWSVCSFPSRIYLACNAAQHQIFVSVLIAAKHIKKGRKNVLPFHQSP